MELNQIEQMTEEIVAMYKQYQKTGTKPWTYEIAAKDLSYQVGSLTKLIMQRTGERFADNKSEEELRKGIADELADILAETLFIAHELDIDLTQAWEDMIRSDESKVSVRQ